MTVGCDLHGVIEYRRDAGSPWRQFQREPNTHVPIVGDREYGSYAVLGNPWNLDELPVMIDRPRGLPDDFVPGDEPHTCLSEKYVWDPSWVSLSDLDQFDWDQTVSGWLLLDEDEYLTWRDGARRQPKRGCRGTSGVVYSEAQYRNFEVDVRSSQSTRRPRVRVVWTDTLRDVVPRLAVDLRAFMRGLGGPDDVRLVFGFNG